MRPILRRAFAAALLVVVCASAYGQSYPARPIRLLIAFGAGGAADIITRSFTEPMAAALQQPFVLENRPGAGGNVAMEAVARAAPDGYTLLFIGPALTINGALYSKLQFDPLKDFVHVSLVGWGPYALFVTSSLPVNNVAELIAYAKSRPRSLNYASVGVGTGVASGCRPLFLGGGPGDDARAVQEHSASGARSRRRTSSPRLQCVSPARALPAERQAAIAWVLRR